MSEPGNYYVPFKYAQYIVQAVEEQTDLEEAVKYTVSRYNESVIPELAHEITSLSLKNEAYLEVFDLLLKHYPENPFILEHKAQAYQFTDAGIAIESLSMALSILHEKGGSEKNITEFYLWIGELYQQEKMSARAISAFTLAIEHYHHEINEEIVLFRSYTKRAEEYLKMKQQKEARKDLLKALEIRPGNQQAGKLLKQC